MAFFNISFVCSKVRFTASALSENFSDASNISFRTFSSSGILIPTRTGLRRIVILWPVSVVLLTAVTQVVQNLDQPPLLLPVGGVKSFVMERFVSVVSPGVAPIDLPCGSVDMTPSFLFSFSLSLPPTRGDRCVKISPPANRVKKNLRRIWGSGQLLLS